MKLHACGLFVALACASGCDGHSRSRANDGDANADAGASANGGLELGGGARPPERDGPGRRPPDGWSSPPRRTDPLDGSEQTGGGITDLASADTGDVRRAIGRLGWNVKRERRLGSSARAYESSKGSDDATVFFVPRKDGDLGDVLGMSDLAALAKSGAVRRDGGTALAVAADERGAAERLLAQLLEGEPRRTSPPPRYGIPPSTANANSADIGVPQCDALIRLMETCPKMPESARESLRQGAQQLRDSYRSALGSSDAARGALASACTQALASMREMCELPAPP